MGTAWTKTGRTDGICAQLRRKQDAGCTSGFDRQTAKYLKGETDG